MPEGTAVKSSANFHFASVLCPDNLLSAMFTIARKLKRNTSTYLDETRRGSTLYRLDTDSVVK
jgi:hypothetical protein